MTKKSSMKRKPKATGRPVTYTDKVAERICVLLVEGYSLRSIDARKDMPSKGTILRWAATNLTFQDLYARACEARTIAMGEEILDLADTSGLTNEQINKARLQIDTRKWVMSKFHPRKYGERLQQVLTGADGGPVKLEQQVSPLEEIEARLARLSDREAVVAAPDVARLAVRRDVN